MIAIQGFLANALWTINTPGSISSQDVSPIFELSPIGATYTRTRAEQQGSVNKNYTYYGFAAFIADTGEEVAVSQEQVDEIIAVFAAVQNYLLTSIPPYDPIDLALSVAVELNNRVNGVTVGDIDVYRHPGSSLTTTVPEWISWQSLLGEGTSLRVWCKSEAFESQYDRHQNVSVDPLPSLDDFFINYQAAVTTITSRSMDDVFRLIESFRADTPETYTRSLRLNYVNRANPTQKTPIDWVVIGYGRAGDNIDVTKDDLVAHILDNSTKTEADWKVIFPELFERTEFVYMPVWWQYAQVNATPNSSIYSSIMDAVLNLARYKQEFPDIPTGHIDQYLQSLPIAFKALFAYVCAGSTNPQGIRSLRGLFPDYIPVDSLAQDFGRMSLNTRNWLTKMLEGFVWAEKTTEFSSLPSNLRRYKRRDKIFVVVQHNQVNHVILTKASVTPIE